MEGSRFDQLARALSASRTRRGVTGLLAAAGALPLLGLAGADGKKKKKCKAPKVKCGKKCLPANACCTDAQCGGNGICQNRICACFTGFRPCNGSCIPAGNCCGDADCGGGICANGRCRCLAGTKPCGGTCIPENGCCSDDECGSPCKTCQNNVCSAGCGAGQTCLANGSCGDTCNPPQCPQGCSCNAGPGEVVCRFSVDGSGCAAATPTCSTTADCPAGKVCSAICGSPNRCIPLCDA